MNTQHNPNPSEMAPNGLITTPTTNLSASSPTSTTSPTGTTTTRADRPRLTEHQKKTNHTGSERRRREAIRAAYDELAAIVPGMEGMGRSESLVLRAAVKEIRKQILIRVKIIEAMKEAGEDTAHLELPKEVVEAALEMQREDPVTLEEGE